MTCRARNVSRAATLGGALGLLLISSVNDVRTQSAPGRVFWRGVNTVSSTGPTCNSQLVQTFEFVGEEVPNTDPKWLSRKVTWDWSESCAADVLVLEATGGATPRRVLRPWTASCVNKGEADLNLEPNPERRGQCQESPALGNISNHIYPTLGWTGPRPPEEMRNGCAYASRSRILGSDGSVHVTTYSVTVSRGQPDAVIDVDRREYEAFVPEPGKTLTFTAKSSRPARFRFELDRAGTSRFLGYATNANVDDVFFMKHDLGHLREQYSNDGADVIFDPERFGAAGWSRRDLHFVETRAAETSVLVPVTAMDYGAVGRLRGYVQSEDCGDSWQPVNVLVNGRSSDAIDLPLDADGNLIADALEQYRGLDSGADDDAEPKGNGIAGDGLTTFEEYRGFQSRGAACTGQRETVPVFEPGLPVPEPFPDEERPSGIPGWSDIHIRTTPRLKDLFVHSLDPELAAMTEDFAWVSDLSVHLICEPHFVDSDTRVVNFTLQQANLRQWRGKRITHDEPQHGILVETVDALPDGSTGLAAAVDPAAGNFGPPRFTLGVAILKPHLIHDRGYDETIRAYRGRVQDESATFTRILTHELSHAVGVPHHGDRVENWQLVPGKMNVTVTFSPFQRDGGSPPRSWTPEARQVQAAANLGGLLVQPGTDCEEHLRLYRDGEFAGCLVQQISRRGQQNSGQFECPMRYAGADYYEAPGSAAVYRWTGAVSGPGLGSMNVDAWEGRLLKYHNELERRPKGKLCALTTGTEINALPGDMNHSGDAGRDKPCRDFVVVNDVAVRGRQ